MLLNLLELKLKLKNNYFGWRTWILENETKFLCPIIAAASEYYAINLQTADLWLTKPPEMTSFSWSKKDPPNPYASKQPRQACAPPLILRYILYIVHWYTSIINVNLFPRGTNGHHLFQLLAQFKRGDCDGIKVRIGRLQVNLFSSFTFIMRWRSIVLRICSSVSPSAIR